MIFMNEPKAYASTEQLVSLNAQNALKSIVKHSIRGQDSNIISKIIEIS